MLYELFIVRAFNFKKNLQRFDDNLAVLIYTWEKLFLQCAEGGDGVISV